MQLLLADLFCPACQAYVHPFLDECPGCGAARSSRYEEALGDARGEPALTDDPAYPQRASEAATKHALSAFRGGLMTPMGAEGVFGADGAPGKPPPGPPLDELVDRIASQLTYRGAGFASQAPVDVDLTVQADALTFRDRKRTNLEAVDPAVVLAAIPLPAGKTAAGSPTIAGTLASPLDSHRLVLIWHGAFGPRQVAVGNRGGLLAARARMAHYYDLARWVGTLAGVRAQSRWRSTGARAHATELGLGRVAGSVEAPEGIPAEHEGRSVRERLEELESLRAGGLVTDAEYAEKRREILAGL